MDNQDSLDILEKINNKDLNHNNQAKEIIQFNNIHFINNNHKNNFILKNSHQLFKKKKNHKVIHKK